MPDKVEIIPDKPLIYQGNTIRLKAVVSDALDKPLDSAKYWFVWKSQISVVLDSKDKYADSCEGKADENLATGNYSLEVIVYSRVSGRSDPNPGDTEIARKSSFINVIPIVRVEGTSKPSLISLQRTTEKPTKSVVLWAAIRRCCKSMFNDYKEYIDNEINISKKSDFHRHFFESVNGYERLKNLTDIFLQTNIPFSFDINEIKEELQGVVTDAEIHVFCQKYFKEVGNNRTPYLHNRADALNLPERRDLVFTKRVASIALQELIWSYWHEESMLVQAMNKISLRFQNKSGNPAKDPLRHLDIDPLRPLNNILWGYIQDEPHRLTIARRAYEYDHHYGIRLMGRAVPQIRSVDSRSKFIEAFHNLLYICTQYYKQLDDTTIYADAFPLRNALREVHILLAEGAHNQYGDLPWTARREMLIQQWILARPEMREFLRGRIMVPYEEEWMGTLDAMKKLQGWNDVSSTHFHNLAIWGEQILLSIRHDNWNESARIAPDAANWAAFWRNEIQGYIHAYRSVTGADLTMASGSGKVDDTMPSVHLQRRLAKAA